MFSGFPTPWIDKSRFVDIFLVKTSSFVKSRGYFHQNIHRKNIRKFFIYVFKIFVLKKNFVKLTVTHKRTNLSSHLFHPFIQKANITGPFGYFAIFIC